MLELFPDVAEAGDEPDGDDAKQPQSDIDGGTGDRDDELLFGVFGHPLESRDASDRQERDISSRDAVAPRSQRVTQLMQDDRPENGDQEDDPVEKVDQVVTAEIVNEGDPRQQDQKGAMDIDADTGDRADPPRPLHRSST